MLHIFNTALNAVAPILLMVLLGYLLRCRGFLTEGFIQVGNKLVFRVLLPCMLFVNIYNITGLSAIRFDLVLYCAAVITVLFLVGLVIALLTTKVPERRGPVAQSCFRSNFAIIGLPLAAAMGTANAIATTAVLSATSIPLFNIFSVFALTVFLPHGPNRKPNASDTFNSIVKNPLIIGVVLGLFVLVLRAVQQWLWGETLFSLQEDLPFLYTFLNNLQSATTPIALIIMGGQFEFSAVKNLKKEILIGTISRLVLAPILGVGLAIALSSHTGLLPLGSDDYPALISLFGTPVAVSSAIMAGEMGNDIQLSVQLVVWTSIASVITVFATICVLMAMGFISI